MDLDYLTIFKQAGKSLPVSRLQPRLCSASVALAILGPLILLPARLQSLTPGTPPFPFFSLSLPHSSRHHHGITVELKLSSIHPPLPCLPAWEPKLLPPKAHYALPFPSLFFLLTEVVAQQCAEGEENGVQV